jgi:hypothetical protein
MRRPRASRRRPGGDGSGLGFGVRTACRGEEEPGPSGTQWAVQEEREGVGASLWLAVRPLGAVPAPGRRVCRPEAVLASRYLAHSPTTVPRGPCWSAASDKAANAAAAAEPTGGEAEAEVRAGTAVVDAGAGPAPVPPGARGGGGGTLSMLMVRRAATRQASTVVLGTSMLIVRRAGTLGDAVPPVVTLVVALVPGAGAPPAGAGGCMRTSMLSSLRSKLQVRMSKMAIRCTASTGHRDGASSSVVHVWGANSCREACLAGKRGPACDGMGGGGGAVETTCFVGFTCGQ